MTAPSYIIIFDFSFPFSINVGQPGSADVSLNDSASTTQSNVTSECSEAECDREPLVKPGDNVGGNRGE